MSDWQTQGIALYMDCPSCGQVAVRAYFNTPELVCAACEFLVRGLDGKMRGVTGKGDVS